MKQTSKAQVMEPKLKKVIQRQTINKYVETKFSDRTIFLAHYWSERTRSHSSLHNVTPIFQTYFHFDITSRLACGVYVNAFKIYDYAEQYADFSQLKIL